MRDAKVIANEVMQETYALGYKAMSDKFQSTILADREEFRKSIVIAVEEQCKLNRLDSIMLVGMRHVLCLPLLQTPKPKPSEKAMRVAGKWYSNSSEHELRLHQLAELLDAEYPDAD